MNDIASLIAAIRSYALRAKLSDKTASLYVFNDSERLELLAKGKATLTFRRFEAAKGQLEALERDLDRGIRGNPHLRRRVQTAKKAARSTKAKRQAVSA